MKISKKNVPTTVDVAAQQLIDSLTEAEQEEFRDADALAMHFGIGLTIRNAWKLHDHDTSIHRDALASEGYGDSGYDPLDGDSISSMIIAKAQEMLHGDAGGCSDPEK
ncbi:DUF6794 domain-containing protein [Allorhodopirellula solitaria]|uniref:DUF6794 domain-containing protein n=1 Tax=Allorhodopirellula solitaria TaxID=2527987 RepID=A0A5C5X1D5_9BACT|nr:DUF6794 domain-containing protein [Allorhodopirellula solitaria]TWT55965.1 hypothetical protein CA85_46730 [Allorhodopirellula solitaria]